MPTVYISFGNPRHIYFRIARAYIKKTDKETSFVGFLYKFQFLRRGKDRFKHKILLFLHTFIAEGCSLTCCPQNSFR